MHRPLTDEKANALRTLACRSSLDGSLKEPEAVEQAHDYIGNTLIKPDSEIA